MGSLFSTIHWTPPQYIGFILPKWTFSSISNICPKNHTHHARDYACNVYVRRSILQERLSGAFHSHFRYFFMFTLGAKVVLYLLYLLIDKKIVEKVKNEPAEFSTKNNFHWLTFFLLDNLSPKMWLTKGAIFVIFTFA